MAIVLVPVYNIRRTTPSFGNNLRLWPNAARGLVRNREDERLQRKMIIAVPSAGTREGLRPVDMSRDLPQVIELLRMVFGESLDGDGHQVFGDSGSPTVQGLVYRLHPAAARLSNGYVWEANGKIVGNATLLTTRAWDRYLVANVAVHPAYRRQGIARRLMEAITTHVENRGGRVILLQVVKDNQSAIDLYKSLGYVSIANMATWYTSASRLREIQPVGRGEAEPAIELLSARDWREAYELDTAHVQADLNWPEPLQPDAYRRGIWHKFTDFLNARQSETWTTSDSRGRLTGLASIYGEWGRSYQLTLRVRPDWAGQLERPLLAKAIRRLHYLPRRNVRIDHPEADELVDTLLRDSNFTVQRILTHMRLDVSR